MQTPSPKQAVSDIINFTADPSKSCQKLCNSLHYRIIFVDVMDNKYCESSGMIWNVKN